MSLSLSFLLSLFVATDAYGATQSMPAERIWVVAERRFIDQATLVAHLAKHPYLLIGEEHDQVRHHQIQAWLIAELAHQSRKPLILMEMLAQNQQDDLQQYLDRHPHDASGLGAAVGWERQGWPDWSIYQPVAQAVLDAQLSLMPANLPQAEVRAIARSGQSALAEDGRLLNLIERPLPGAVQAKLEQALREGHCNLLPEAALPNMRLAQRARDAYMALRLHTAGRRGAILIAGNGHVRRDFGVPFYLHQIAPQADSVSLGLLAVDQPPTVAELASEASYQDYDYLWLTPRGATPDRCEQLKARWPSHAAAGS
jgi:uncharacterized iron-regulated protein